MFVPVAGVATGRIRAALADAEGRLLAHSWQLRRIAPDEVREARDARDAPAVTPVD